MISVTRSISLEDDEIIESFVRASGPGGQNVNKVATAVELRFDAAASPSLPDEVKARLVPLAGRRMTKDGVIVLFADRFRTQERNRADALGRLVDLIRQAATRSARNRALKAGRKRHRMRDFCHTVAGLQQLSLSTPYMMATGRISV
jgi:ribosome-associated protein